MRSVGVDRRSMLIVGSHSIQPWPCHQPIAVRAMDSSGLTVSAAISSARAAAQVCAAHAPRRGIAPVVIARLTDIDRRRYWSLRGYRLLAAVRESEAAADHAAKSPPAVQWWASPVWRSWSAWWVMVAMRAARSGWWGLRCGWVSASGAIRLAASLSARASASRARGVRARVGRSVRAVIWPASWRSSAALVRAQAVMVRSAARRLRVACTRCSPVVPGIPGRTRR